MRHLPYFCLISSCLMCISVLLFLKETKSSQSYTRRITGHFCAMSASGAAALKVYELNVIKGPSGLNWNYDTFWKVVKLQREVSHMTLVEVTFCTNVLVKLRWSLMRYGSCGHKGKLQRCSPFSLTSLPRTVLSLRPGVFPLVADAQVKRFIYLFFNFWALHFTDFNISEVKKRKCCD